MRFRGKGRALQRAAARRLGRRGEDPTKTRLRTPSNLRRIVKLLLSWRLSIFASHPMTADQLAMLKAAASAPTGEPLLLFDEWRALKAICNYVSNDHGDR